jgi:hypothetical protein
MVALVIAFPAMVMHYKAAGPKVEPSKVEEQLRQLPGLDLAPPPPPVFGPPSTNQ